MTNQSNLVDYQAEAKTLEDFKRDDYWNAKEGKFEVIALSEISKYQQAYKDGTLKEKAKLDIEVVSEKKRYIWTMGIGMTKASLYGQLIALATKNSNKLTGVKFIVVIKNDGTKRDFTIV
jgi:hypothetical protein